MDNILEPRKNSSSGSILLLLMKETEAQEGSVIYSRGHCWKEIMLKGQKVSLFFQESFLRTSHHTVGKQEALIKRAQVLAPVNIHPESLLLERFIPACSLVGCIPKPAAWRMRQIKPVSTESIMYKILLPFPGKSSNWVRFPYKFSLFVAASQHSRDTYLLEADFSGTNLGLNYEHECFRINLESMEVCAT